jgi:LCP family protein required for cell wall assembly
VTKINAAYAYGGPKLTVATVQNFLGVPIQYYVKLGSESFARIIDALGGIEINVEKDMKYRDWWGGLDINLKKGPQVLDGQRASDYIRFRHDAAADIGRVGRQQKMLMALFQKGKNPATLVHAPQLLRAVAKNTQTNLSMGEMIMLGTFGVRLKSADIHFATLPGWASQNDWEPDRTKIRPLVAEMFYGVDKTTLASTGIEILNSSGVPGLARKTAERLRQLGFHVVRIDSVTPIANATTIIDRSGRPHVARWLADVLRPSRILRESGRGADITVVLARDQAGRAVSTMILASR